MKLCTAVQEGCGYKDTLSAIATLLRWQNISLCALLIRVPTYLLSHGDAVPIVEIYQRLDDVDQGNRERVHIYHCSLD